MQRVTLVIIVVSLLLQSASRAQQPFPISEGWARTKVNATIFRRNALCSLNDQQVAAFYNAEGQVVLARRTIHSDQWHVKVTPFVGRTADAHNGISIALDGEGYLHMAWDHHGSPLKYCRSRSPLSMEFDAVEPMVVESEQRVTYPEFYRLPDGDLLFFYRDGSSGSGNLVLNRYDVKQQRWRRLHNNLIDGQGKRNAYWQVAIDRFGHIHLSWVWRETPDVVTNHDIAYAKSTDGGLTWIKTTEERYAVPINESSAEYAVRIPQFSELANQTSMAADFWGHPYIANFWRESPEAVPQYRIVMHDSTSWKTIQVGERTLDFHRRGGGTKRPPVSRPLILLDSVQNMTRVFMLFRDQERGAKISIAYSDVRNLDVWNYKDLTSSSVGQSDPMIDPNVWEQFKEIHLLTQFVGQGDGEKQEDVTPQMVSVVEWKPLVLRRE